MSLLHGMFALASTLAITVAGAQAAPNIGARGAVDDVVSATEKSAYRTCGQSHGRRHCIKVYGHRSATRDSARAGAPDPNATPTWYPHDSSVLPFGSKIWWEQKAREGGGDNRP
jgi:hypothetical protein